MYQNTDESLKLINDYESKKRKGKKKNCSLYEYERNFYKIGALWPDGQCWEKFDSLFIEKTYG